VAIAAVSLSPATSADVLYLQGGRTIRAASWWIDGEVLVYESAGGTVGIPRDLVERIEAVEEPEYSSPPPAEPMTPRSAARLDSLVLFEGLAERTARLAAGKSALERREFEAASRTFLDLIRSDPDLSAARVGYTLAEMAMDRDQLALDVVLEGLAREPGHPRLRELLGDLRNREERVEEAVREWREAFRAEPSDRLREKIGKGERELQAGRYYTFATTPHFNVRHDEDLDPDLASEVVDTLEAQYWSLADRLRHAPPQPITVLLYPKTEFHDVTRAPENVAGLYDGKIRVPLGGVRRLDPRARSLLVHELTHAVVHSKTRGNCPRWLHEGLAQRMEGRELTEANRVEILSLLDGIPPHSWQDQILSYPAALSLVRYLESRRGFDGLVRLLDTLSDGADVPRAVFDVYGESYEELCRRWSRDLHEGDRR